MHEIAQQLSGVPSQPDSSVWLLLAGAGLLLVAGLMLLFRRRAKVALERSPLTDEVVIYLSRIADALERQADRPTAEQIVNVLQRKAAEQKERESRGSQKGQAIPFATPGREYEDTR